MGRGSQDNKVRKEFRAVAGKSDWKATILTKADATELIKRVEENIQHDPNGAYFMATYFQKKKDILNDYIKNAPAGVSLKQYEHR